MSDHDHGAGNGVGDDGHDGVGDGVEEEPTPLQRALELLVFAPVGVALTVAEDLPGLIGKGRQRFESDVHSARVVGRFFVTHVQRQLVDRVGKLLQRETSGESGDSAATDVRANGAIGTPLPAAVPKTNPKPDADPADEAIVETALAGYDTLSASQVVRRLESLGPDELRALHRYEASHRNRRTILNRAQQILETMGTGASALSSTATPSARTPSPSAAAPPSAAEATAPDRSGQ